MHSIEDHAGKGAARNSRWTVLAVFAIVCVLTCMLVFEPSHAKSVDQTYPGWFVLGWLLARWGALMGLLSVCAVWASLAQQPLRVRLPWGFIAAAFFGLITLWKVVKISPEGPHLVVMVFVLTTMCMTVAALSGLRRRYGWRLRLKNEAPGQGAGLSSGRLLLRLFFWTTGLVAFFGAMRWIVPDWDLAVRDLKVQWLVVTLYAILTSALTLPLIIASVALVFRRRSRKQLMVWLAAIALVIALIVVLSATLAGLTGIVLASVGCFSPASYLVVACGSLFAMWQCGFRVEGP